MAGTPTIAFLDGKVVGRNKRICPGLPIRQCPYESLFEATEWVSGVLAGLAEGKLEEVSNEQTQTLHTDHEVRQFHPGIDLHPDDRPQQR